MAKIVDTGSCKVVKSRLRRGQEGTVAELVDFSGPFVSNEIFFYEKSSKIEIILQVNCQIEIVIISYHER